MAENFALAEATLEFADGKEADWLAFDKIIPANLVIFTTDTMRFKKGNGADLYSALPDGPSFAEVQAGSLELVSNLVLFDLLADDSIIYINNNRVDVSTTTVTSILDRISLITAEDLAQNTELDVVDSQNLFVDSTVSTADDGKFAVATSGKVSPGVTIESIGGLVVPAANVHIKGINIYTDDGLVNQVTNLRGGLTYFVEVDGFSDEVPNDVVSFTMVEGSSLTAVSQISTNVFKVVVAPTSVLASVSVTATVEYGLEVATGIYTLEILTFKPIVGIYGGAGSDTFSASAVDSSGNIVCVGKTASEGAGLSDALIVKFDNAMTILERSTYGGAGTDSFSDLSISSTGDIVCVGRTDSEGTAVFCGLVVSFTSSLAILYRKVYGGADSEFLGVAHDSINNVVCVGGNLGEGAGGSDMFIVKLDSALVTIASKVYGGLSDDYANDVAIDSLDNIIVAGYSLSEGSGVSDALVIKCDSSLTILSRKVYGGLATDVFHGVAVDSLDNVICVGSTDSEGSGLNDALVVKFDVLLIVTAAKECGGAADDVFTDVAVDSLDTIVCSGYTTSEGAGLTDALIVKLDGLLNLLDRKFYGGSGADTFSGISIDAENNIACAGSTSSEGQASDDALLVKFPADLPSGTFTGTVFTGLVLADSAMLTLDSLLVVSDSVLTIADTVATFSDSALVLSISDLAYEQDTIG